MIAEETSDAKLERMKPVTFVILAVVILGGAFFIFSPQKQSATNTPLATATTTQAKVFELVVTGRKLVSGPATLQATEGDTVTIKITVDEDTELHLHGYDKHVDLTKNQPGELTFTANLTGRFSYELEESKTDIGTLEVSPK
jgi:plastocyanin